jgi:rhamnose utilization protein RhaD (predicted bifunctional aldolase and dehydrogenase)
MPELTELIQLSRFAGERFDLVQASAGNASLKTDDDTMLIKASGLKLSEVHSERELCQVSVNKLIKFVAESENAEDDRSTDSLDRVAMDCLLAANRSKGKLPSNETFLHALLGPLTLHTHPPVVTSIVCQRGWREKIAGVIQDALFVDYRTPGIRSAIATRAVLEESGWKKGDRAIIFLQNHGLVVT